MSLSKKDFDSQLKKDAAENKFTVQGNYIVFDNRSNLSYVLIAGYTLGNLLTANPLSSYTKLNKDLLVKLGVITDSLKGKCIVRSSYRSPEYNLLSFGASRDSKHVKGDALDLGFDDALFINAFMHGADGLDVGRYTWGCHIAISQTPCSWDARDESYIGKAKGLLSRDVYRNYGVYGLLALLVFILFKRIF